MISAALSLALLDLLLNFISSNVGTTGFFVNIFKRGILFSYPYGLSDINLSEDPSLKKILYYPVFQRMIRYYHYSSAFFN